ncbi:hypothetical protein [Streptomyces violaceusniger]|uniref:Uncharacterized protein n=1 Tax=Streptomyces violaceusniger (strain Tu 4113) TaxID=653045 RepID=G2P793_STRV4|nr:hypothetical protein [Streptomyces violaceusniger]AEM87053.1 hypothetical protein Strvi_7718 [Streptomyces violaceusniger Tu 4113]
MTATHNEEGTTGRVPRSPLGQWPIPRTELPSQEDDIRARYNHERARFHLTLGAIRADLEEQPSPSQVRAASRRWIEAIAQMTDEAARAAQRKGAQSAPLPPREHLIQLDEESRS